jgi:hypothetical protein
VFADVLPVVDELVAQRLFEMRVNGTQTRDAVHGITREMEPVEFVEHGHIEWSGGGAFLPITVNMEIDMVRALVGQTVNVLNISARFSLKSRRGSTRSCATNRLRMAVLTKG